MQERGASRHSLPLPASQGGARLAYRRAVLAFALCALTQPAFAQAPFYAGKQLSILINLSAGGPTDTEARLVARHIGKHIAGNPSIVPRNMTGAGGMVAANWLGQVAPPDGLTLGFFTSVTSASATASPSLKVDITKYAFAGTGSGVSVTYTRKDTGGGLTSPDELVKKPEVWVGGLAVDSDKDLRLRLQLDMLGMKYRYVTGYPGAADVRLAIQRGEIQMTSESMPSYRAAVEPTLVDKGVAIALWIDVGDEANNPHPHEAKGIDATTFHDYFTRVKGKKPAGLEWEAFDTMNTLARGFERILVMAPGTPKEAVEAVRKALVALKGDEEYRRDAMAMMKFVPEYETSEAAEKIYREKAAPNPKIVAFYEKYVEEGRAQSAKK